MTINFDDVSTIPPKMKLDLASRLIEDLLTSGNELLCIPGSRSKLYVYRAPENAKENARKRAEQCTPEEREILLQRAESGPEGMDIDELIRTIPAEVEAARASR